jgi:peptide methionine sulfoxide reductase MsrA
MTPSWPGLATMLAEDCHQQYLDKVPNGYCGGLALVLSLHDQSEQD